MREWGTELWDQLEKVDARFVALSGKNDQLVRFLREKETVNHVLSFIFFLNLKLVVNEHHFLQKVNGVSLA